MSDVLALHVRFSAPVDNCAARFNEPQPPDGIPCAAFALTWVDGRIYCGRAELARQASGEWLAHVVELHTQIERAPEPRTLFDLVTVTRSRIRLAAAREHINATLARATALTRRRSAKLMR